MMHDLIPDYNLRGYAFEYIIKVLLRRRNQHNFIFQTILFDDIDELLRKYRFSFHNEKVSSLITYLQEHGLKGDLIEFVCNNEREIINILFYDVKTKTANIKKSYIEMCRSDFNFFRDISRQGFPCLICSVTLFASWKFAYELIPFSSKNIRIYSRYKK